jgi:hypothetical protein
LIGDRRKCVHDKLPPWRCHHRLTSDVSEVTHLTVRRASTSGAMVGSRECGLGDSSPGRNRLASDDTHWITASNHGAISGCTTTALRLRPTRPSKGRPRSILRRCYRTGRTAPRLRARHPRIVPPTNVESAAGLPYAWSGTGSAHGVVLASDRAITASSTAASA